MVVNIRDLQVKDDFIVSISGTVTSIREDEFILSDRTGQILVDAAPGKGQIFGLNVGEQVTVVGDLDDADFDAISITRANGSIVPVQAGSKGGGFSGGGKGGKGDFGGSKGGKGNFGGDFPVVNPINPTPGVTTPIANLQVKDDFIVSISGTVTSIREDEFILSDRTGQILVDAAPGKGQIFGLNVGEQVTVLGDLDDADFDAISITRANGSIVPVQAGSKGGGFSGGGKGGKGNFGGDFPVVNPINPTPGVTTPIANLQVKDDFIVSISGTVTSIREDEFILSDRTGQILVDAAPGKGQIFGLNVGEQVTVLGDLDDEDFDAISITRANGSIVPVQAGTKGGKADFGGSKGGKGNFGGDFPVVNPINPTPGVTTPIANLQVKDDFIVSISGTVTSIREDEFILSDRTGQILVDADLGKGQILPLTVGEQVTVVGDLDDEDFDAISITRANGSIIPSQPGVTQATAIDPLIGSSGNDFISGGQNQDNLVGGEGNDTLSGGLGVDTLTGGAGNDLFILRRDDAGSALSNVDTIADFTPGDRIGFTGGLSQANLSLEPFSNFGQNGTLIQVASTGEVLGYVANVAPTNLSGALIDL